MSEIVRSALGMISALEIPFYAGVSIMDLVRLAMLLTAVSMIIYYFFNKAAS